MNIDKSLIVICFLYYFYRYGTPPVISSYFFKLYVDYFHIFVMYSKLFYSNDLYDNTELFIQNKSEYQNNDNSVYEAQTKKYEDKYLQYIRCVHKEWEFTEDEKKQIPELNNTFFNEYLENKNERIEDITKQNIDIETEITKYDDDVKCVEDFDYDDIYGNELILEERNEKRNKIRKLQEEYNEIKLMIGTEKGLDELRMKSHEYAEQYIIDKRIDKLKRCYVM
jgi:hypothetical protein